MSFAPVKRVRKGLRQGLHNGLRGGLRPGLEPSVGREVAGWCAVGGSVASADSLGVECGFGVDGVVGAGFRHGRCLIGWAIGAVVTVAFGATDVGCRVGNGVHPITVGSTLEPAVPACSIPVGHRTDAARLP